MSSCPHTEFRRGQKVFVIMNSGDRFTDKYRESKSGCVILKVHGRVKTREVRSISIFNAKG